MRNSDDTIGIILHQAGGLFNSHGYKAHLYWSYHGSFGFTKGAIYRHFKSKEKLEEEALGYLSGICFENLTKRIKAQYQCWWQIANYCEFLWNRILVKPPIKGGCPLLNVAVENG